MVMTASQPNKLAPCQNEISEEQKSSPQNSACWNEKTKNGNEADYIKIPFQDDSQQRNQ